MGRITYKMKDYSKQYLQSKGFRYNRTLSDSSEEIYTYRFPLISYNKITTIECEISVSITTGMVNINVINSSTRELYASYYNREYGNFEIVKLIDTKISKKIKELGIEMA